MSINSQKDSDGNESVELRVVSDEPKYMKLKDGRDVVKFKVMGSDNVEYYICTKKSLIEDENDLNKDNILKFTLINSKDNRLLYTVYPEVKGQTVITFDESPEVVTN